MALKHLLLMGTFIFSTQAFANGNGGGKQVSVNELNDISDSLRSGMISLFEACAKKVLGNDSACTLENMGTTRDPNASWGAKNSCHKNRPADAVDIGAIHCGGASMKPKDPQYAEMARCLANQDGLQYAGGGMALRVIYGNGTASDRNLIGDPSGKHDDHIHAMVPGCSYGNGGPATYGYTGSYEGEGGNPDYGRSPASSGY